MVTQWGMSDSARTDGVRRGTKARVFLGRSVTNHKNVSEATMQQVDNGDSAHHRRAVWRRAQDASKSIRAQIEVMAAALLEWETLDAEQLDDIMAGKPPRPPKPTSDVPPKAPADSGSTPGAASDCAAAPA
jgi:cell division protease FtsH